MLAVKVHSNEQLVGDLDFQESLEAIPRGYMVKGMFLGSMVSNLGTAAWEELKPRLDAPPRWDRYLPFTDYPQRDHFRIVYELVRRRFSGYGTREGMRRVARDDLRIFASSLVGRAMLGAVGNAVDALLLLPLGYRHVVRGQELEGHRVSQSEARLEWRYDDGRWEYNLGQVEGIVLHFCSGCTTRILEANPSHQILEIKLDAV